MNLILFQLRQIHYDLASADAANRHIREVLRMGHGDRVMIGAVNDCRAAALIEDLGNGVLRLVPEWEQVPPGHLNVEMICGLPRPQTARRILFESACLGVRRLTFFGSDRGEPSYRESRLWTSDEWRRHLIQGAEQACSTTIPQIAHSDTLKTALEKRDVGFSDIALDVYEATQSAATSFVPGQSGFNIAIGSERGWSSPEREVLREAGFTLAHLGERVRRTESAVNAALTLAAHALGDF